ncbi:MAG: ADP-forming succinate--CoA ligase subunit beta [Deltaproteobacteria bacterium]|nr:ADP-forming succinate--CoA ligase subunit beta [Deltaproteobacteria bacterium]
MNVHEYQAKELLRRYNVPLLNGKVAESVDQAVSVTQELGGSVWVVKAQIHAGGRGKGGGVKVAKTRDDVKKYASQILGMQLVTPQTGPEGKKVRKLFVEQGCEIARELYCAMLIDRATSKVMFMVSQAGGMDIEEVAHKTPEKIFKLYIDPVTGFMPYHGRRLAFALDIPKDSLNKAGAFFASLYKAFVDLDCSLCEINPLVLTKSGDVIALDAKLNFDDSALFRHKDIAEMRDPNEESAQETEAAKYDLAFISLDGTIGCMVNGAGLAMATLDIIKLHGAEPANFLDVGGGANKEKVTAAFKIILKDPKVKAILVNIFGGIMKCDVIAEGIIAAAKEVNLSVPLVARLEGTNVEQGKKLLAESGLKITPASDLTDAAQKVVAAAKGAK